MVMMVGLASSVSAGVRVTVGARALGTQAHLQQVRPCQMLRPLGRPRMIKPLRILPLASSVGLMTRAVEDLTQAVVVTVIGSTPLAPANDVAAAIATRMDVEAASLVLRRASSSSYLLFLPIVESVDRLVSLRQPLRSTAFSLLCKRWSRLAGATGRALPCLVDFELRGIPAHVWETSTVEQFLSPYGWIDHVHSDTLRLADLSTFWCSAWCSDLSSIPRSKELWVTEPPSAIVEDPPVKRILAYPIDVQA
jgi:hypothetical protein